MGIATTVVETLGDGELFTLQQACNEEISLRAWVKIHNKRKAEKAPELPFEIGRKIKEGFPNNWRLILEHELKWNSLGQHWHFNFAGMYVGVEKDGYIHT